MSDTIVRFNSSNSSSNVGSSRSVSKRISYFIRERSNSSEPTNKFLKKETSFLLRKDDKNYDIETLSEENFGGDDQDDIDISCFTEDDENTNLYSAEEIINFTLSIHRTSPKVSVYRLMLFIDEQISSNNLHAIKEIIDLARHKLDTIPLKIHLTILMATLPVYFMIPVRKSYYRELFFFVKNNTSYNPERIMGGLSILGRNIKSESVLSHTGSHQKIEQELLYSLL